MNASGPCGPSVPGSTRVTASLTLGAGILLFVAIGALWLHDRSRLWEEPRWHSGRFELIARPAAGAAGDGELWLVAVNPDCGHCAGSLANAAAVRDRRADDTGLHALIVDQPGRPARDVFRGHDVDVVWWDEHGVWRRRWGHRVYGEVLRFDASGRYLGTWPPEQVARNVPDP
jgi:hypothetical protein